MNSVPGRFVPRAQVDKQIQEALQASTEIMEENGARPPSDEGACREARHFGG